MKQFLIKCKKDLDQIAKEDGNICVVLGNQACDLDSAVSALVHARHLSHSGKFGFAVLPLLNIVREDYVLKTEVKYYLNKFGITAEHLFFRDDIDLAALHRKGTLKLVLLDHNILPPSDAELDEAVVQIIDHHALEHPPSERLEMLVEPVGSCSTLVATLIQADAPDLLNSESALLLLGPIVVDTANFSPTVKWATEKDRDVFSKLSQLTPAGFSKDSLYTELLTAKEAITGLTMKQLLTKDGKIVINSSSGIRLFVSAFPCLSSTVLEKHPDAEEAMENYCAKDHFEGGLLLGIEINKETNTIRRDLVVFSKFSALRNQLCDGLERGEPNLELVKGELPQHQAQCALYRQGNVAATRKKIIPMLKALKLDSPHT